MRGAPVDPTDARNSILGCVGRSDRSALRQSEGRRLRSAAPLLSGGKMLARQNGAPPWAGIAPEARVSQVLSMTANKRCGTEDTSLVLRPPPKGAGSEAC